MALFNIPDSQPEDGSIPEDRVRENFDSHEDFVKYLDTHYHKITSDDLHVVMGITEVEEDAILEGLNSRGWESDVNMGSVERLMTEKDDDDVGAYFHFDSEDGLARLYSNESKTKHLNAIASDIDSLTNVSKLYLSRWQIKNLVEDLRSHSDNEVYSSRVIAKRHPSSEVDCEIESPTGRTINYYSPDALDILDDLEQTYGVLPDIIDLNLASGTKFSIDTSGIFKLMNGSISELFETVDPVIEETIEVKDAYAGTQTATVQLPASESSVSESTPALIQPGSADTFALGAIERLLHDALPDQGHAVINSFVEQDESYYYANIYDNKRGVEYEIKGDRKEMQVYPRVDQRELSAFMDVFELVQKIADTEAEAHENEISIEVDAE